MQWRKFTRLKTSATGHSSRCKAMLCCGRRKENGRSVPDLTASPGRAPHPGPMPSNQGNSHMQRQGVKEPVLLQGDFRKVSGISSEIFRQIEAVENDHDPSTAAALEAVERRGEMIVRILEPRYIGGRQAVESAQKFLAKADARHTVQMVEIVKRPGQTLGLYIREGNGADRSDGVFISRIALESAVYNSGCLRVGDEILAVNLVDVTKMSLDDVVIIMSIPRRLVLAIRTRRGGRGSSSPGPPPLSRPEQKPPPVVVIKRDLRDEEMDEPDRAPRSRSSRERRTGDGREMSESRSRLGLGLTNYSPSSEQLDLYYNSRPNTAVETPSWGYKPPPPPSVITEQPKGAHQFQPSHAYYQNAGTLESLAEKVHSFYPGPSRRMSAGTGVAMSQSHQRFPRSGSDQHLPRVEYSDYSSSLGRHNLLRSSLKTGAPITGGTLGRYGGGGGRYDPQPTSSRNAIKYSSPASSAITRRSRPNLDYSSDTEATIGPRPSYYYYNRPAISTLGRQSTSGTAAALGGGPEYAKFNSLPRDRPGVPSARLGLRSRLVDRLGDDSDGNLSAPEYSLPTIRSNRAQAAVAADIRSRIAASPSIFTSDEYRAWLRRAPSSSAICEQMRASRDILNQQRAHRFSCSAENIHDALKNTENIYSARAGLIGTLDRNTLGIGRGLSSLPVRSMSSQHIGGPSALRSPNIRRMRQLLELSAGVTSPGSGLSGHQSPAPTPSTTLPRTTQRQIDINPAEFVKYKLDKPVIESQGLSGMLWLHLLAGRGLRATPEGVQATTQVRDLYCVLECDRMHKARTVVRSGDLQFDWDESFELDLVNNKQLDVLVYSWDPQHRHKLCYRGAISLTTLIRQSPIHQLALKVEPRGTIYLRLKYSDPVQLYRRRGLPQLRGAPTALFGVDLETVVTREAKGNPGSAPVPIILRRCVEEVERRGLDIIGLYRLCGSATKKRLLREAFERNSRAVELSPEHVPDINVITGVIKDYLRELPEPLFTKCLFQMTVDALGVCLPDDPEGNAKLMLSILDCLPRANRATLVFLLDHLSLVVSASERNKMSAQALATALGPPLMLHSSGTSTGEEVDHAQPIAVLKYLLQIWPQPANAAHISGRRGEPTGQRGNKVNVSQVGKPSLNTTHSASNPLIGRPPQLSATASSHQYQSVVGQLAQSHRVLQPVPMVQQPLQLGASAASAERGQSQPQPLATPSPSSSSSTTSSESGSGTDTIKRGASPASGSNESNSTARFKESSSNYSIKQETNNDKKSCLKTDKDDYKTTIMTTSDNVTLTATATTAHGPINNQSEPLSDILAYSTSVSFKDTPTPPSTKSSPLEFSSGSKISYSIPTIINNTTSSSSPTTATAAATIANRPVTSTSTPTSSSTYSSAHLNSLLRNTNDNINNMSMNTSNNTNNNNNTNNGSSSSQSYESIGKSYMGSYQFPSSHIKATTTTTSEPTTATATTTMSAYTTKLDDLPFSTASTSSTLSKISSASVSSSSPSRTNNNNTINSSTLGRTKYQSENYAISSYSSPVSSSNQSSAVSSIYGTLPKTNPSSSTAGGGKYATSSDVDSGETSSASFLSKYTSNYTFNYNTDYTSNYSGTASTTFGGGTDTGTSTTQVSSGGNGNGFYPVQYSSTNPFLPTFDPSSTEKSSDNKAPSDTSSDNSNLPSYLRGSNGSNGFSSSSSRFEKLDKEEDLK